MIVLDLKFKFGGIEDAIHPVVLTDDKSMVLIDCGYPGFLPVIEQALEENNLTRTDLTHVLITHQDHDHMGALAAIKQKYLRCRPLRAKRNPHISPAG
jgi:glyoxylase-like metal-dependent hydrolase (beta-lactamase superfamily II)